jgi:hypothetical protein
MDCVEQTWVAKQAALKMREIRLIPHRISSEPTPFCWGQQNGPAADRRRDEAYKLT